VDVTIRPVEVADVPAVVAMVHELAEYERAADQCQLTSGELRTALFASQPALFGHVAVRRGEPEPVGFALWFRNFSTWRGAHGIYLEDLYVRPTARGAGVGRALLARLATICVERGYERIDFGVLQWNPARDFYHSLGAVPQDEWVGYRLTGEPLRRLAAATVRQRPRTGAKAVKS